MPPPKTVNQISLLAAEREEGASLSFQREAESRIRLRSSWRGSGGRFEQADGRRSAGPKELRRLPSAEAQELLVAAAA